MLAIVEPGNLDAFMAVCERWEVEAATIGTVTDGKQLRILDRFDGEVLADVPASTLHEDAPLLDRPRAEPADRAARLADVAEAALPAPVDAGADLLDLLCDMSWVWSQYDHQLFLNTVAGPGPSDAAVLRLKHPTTGAETGRGLALTTDGNHRWCALDPRQGTALVVAEAVANLACTGARPLALVNCLNFGNPTHPEVMWQLSEAVDGMGDACRALSLPVVGGNVSLYNESRGANIDPTPLVGVVGLIDRLEVPPPGAQLVDGATVLLIGTGASTSEGNGNGSSAGSDDAFTLSGSQWTWQQGHKQGTPPALDLSAHRVTCDVVRSLVIDGLLVGVHDAADGGIGLSLAEMAVHGGVGVEVTPPAGADHRWLFAESPSRFVVVAEAGQVAEIERRCAESAVSVAALGRCGGDRIVIGDLDAVDLNTAVEAWRGRLPELLGQGTTQG
jgi:phosphoribosylformylglycinamidine synthase